MHSIHYCTLFDSFYLPQALALYKSIRRFSPGSILWALAMDPDAHSVLKELNLPGLRLLSLFEIETPELLDVKAERTHGEYCWTLTPVLIRYVLQLAHDSTVVTYIDADCWFAGPATPLINSFLNSGSDCMITPHAFPDGSELASTAGTYCVQFMPFKKTNVSYQILNLWRSRCIKSCSSLLDGCGLGDQAHLEDWPDLFGDHVFVLDCPELTLAPWNVEHLAIARDVPLCLYHFQGLRLYRFFSLLIIRASVNLSLPRFLKYSLYHRYISDVRLALGMLSASSKKIKSLPTPFADPRGYLLLIPRIIFLKWKIWMFY